MTDFAERFWSNNSLKQQIAAVIANTLWWIANYVPAVRVKKGRGQRRNRRNK